MKARGTSKTSISRSPTSRSPTIKKAQTERRATVSQIQAATSATLPLWREVAGAQLEALRAAKAKLSTKYLTSKKAHRMYRNASGISTVPEINVVGVGIGEKTCSGALTGRPCLKLYVRKKFRNAEIDAAHQLPTSFNGFLIDVEEIGGVRRLLDSPNPRTMLTPLQPGCSVGFAYPATSQMMAGTFGALVRDQNKALNILSNSHVLAFEVRLPIGSPIFQCGLLDMPPGARPRPVATLKAFADLNAKPLNVDAAVAELRVPTQASSAVMQIGPPKGTNEAASDMIVHKFGRTHRLHGGPRHERVHGYNYRIR